ncbi:uncharacterized protein LOC117894149 [Drosophila subobscura]|uniref:uncharacterized protein LOC117894149 n=1 Tax=Drosophila subobscura TaxID=7241 RepID=UPI00155A089D|nr:uncharacterized protein LOC117894149 [Drosophila subobscura]
MLTKLPIEIIDKILGYLPEEDQLQVAQVNQQLGLAFAYHAKEEYKTLFFYKFEGNKLQWRYTHDELRVILSLCGSTVEKIIAEPVILSPEINELIEKYCINLKTFVSILQFLQSCFVANPNMIISNFDELVRSLK